MLVAKCTALPQPVLPHPITLCESGHCSPAGCYQRYLGAEHISLPCLLHTPLHHADAGSSLHAGGAGTGAARLPDTPL